MSKPINVTKPFLTDEKEYISLLNEIWDSDWLTNNGPLSRRLCDKLKQYLGAEYLSLTANGHMAMENMLGMLPKKGKVITTPFTFASTTHAIVRAGMEPVFCDIKESDYTLDPDKAEEMITEDTVAVMPVHIYGHPCDVRAFERISQQYKVPVLYDAAHAFGAKLDGRSLCTYGDMAGLSFHATKLFHTVEGGAVICRDDQAENRLNLIRNFGIQSPVSVAEIGGNTKMSELHAAMGLVNINHIDELIEERKLLTFRYREHLSGISGIRFFTPEEACGFEYNYAYFPVMIDAAAYGRSRDDLYDRLSAEGIYTRKYFYPLTSRMECYQYLNQQDTAPIAEKAASSVLSLPLYNGLEFTDIDEICRIINDNRQG